MPLYRFIYFLTLAILLSGCNDTAPSPSNPAPAASPTPNEPRRVIFDTDIGGDIDDLGALHALHVYADSGYLDIAGVMSSWAMRYHPTGIDAVNTYFGRPDIPVGRYDGEVYDTKEYTWYVGTKYPADLTWEDAPTAVTLYRRLLAAAPDTSMTIIVTGRVNNIYELLHSPADTLSPLDGMALVRQKVKEFFIMGGSYNRVNKNEANFRWSGPGVARYVMDSVPRPVTLNGGMIGNMKDGYGTGSRLNELAEGAMMRNGYRYFFQNPPDWAPLTPSDSIPDWSIWDIITVQLAATGVQEYFTIVDQGNLEVDEEGLTTWQPTPDGPHRYLSIKMDPNSYADGVIEPLLLTPPRATTGGLSQK